MPPFLQFSLRRIALIPLTLFIITLVLYAGVMLTPPEARVTIYLPKGNSKYKESFVKQLIKSNYLDQPYAVQYAHWIKTLVSGSWGFSPSLGEEVLPALMRRTPVTIELALYSLLLFIPLGLANGLMAGWKPNSTYDTVFRGAAFFATSMPTFILSMLLLSLFYIKLGWFAPERFSPIFASQISSPDFHAYTGLLTVDSLLNARLDIFLDAVKHLTLPVVTLSLYHWATLGRITRAATTEEQGKEYIIAAKARGIREKMLIWKHALRGLLSQSLTSIGLSAANILTGVFIVEIIFTINGVSAVIVKAMRSGPDAPAALGFSIYSVLLVIGLMFILDIVIALVDPRVRDGILKS